jgi:hypothetical protein
MQFVSATPFAIVRQTAGLELQRFRTGDQKLIECERDRDADLPTFVVERCGYLVLCSSE